MEHRMLKKSWVGPLTVAGFGLVAVSGVLMLFHAHRTLPGLKSMHEWMGLLFTVAAALHLALNWRAFLGYFRGGLHAWGIAAAVLVLGAGMMALGAAKGPGPHGGPGGGPAMSGEMTGGPGIAAGGQHRRGGVTPP